VFETLASQNVENVWPDGPGALIRTMDGCITYWSPEMERRYGYAPEQALGKVARKLLRTTSWQAVDEIEAILANRNFWRGGLIHYRADGQPVIASNHWYLHQAQGRTLVVTELHSDIVPAGTPAGSDLADIFTAMTHQLSEPLTAVSGYVSAAKRDLHPAWPDKVRASQAINRAVRQLARARETLNRMRALGAKLRDVQQVDAHVRLTATMEQIERTMQGARAAISAAVVQQEGERLCRAVRPDEKSLERTIALQNIQLFQRLLQQDGSVKLDTRTRQVVVQLLADEKAKLAASEGG
jgi:PAS domain S-box-containing protein